MKRRKKQLNIFSMSALDLFASALGAFILLSLILIPYYENITKDTKAKSTPECPAPEKAKQCPVCPVITPKVCPKPQPPTAKKIVQDNMLLVTIEWFKYVDVDLVVHAPGGRKYFWGKKRYPGLDASFVYDNFATPPANGRPDGKPKVEIWRVFKPVPGVYRVCGWLHKIHANNPMPARSVQFKIRLDKPTGSVEPAMQTFQHAGQDNICPIKFRMSRNFELTMIS